MYICLRLDIPKLINNTDTIITEKIDTHTIQGFSKYIKRFVVNDYHETCTAEPAIEIFLKYPTVSEVIEPAYRFSHMLPSGVNA